MRIARLGYKEEFQKQQRSTSTPEGAAKQGNVGSRARSVPKSILKRVKNSAKRILDPPTPPPSKKQPVSFVT